jgi:hypothetical protein
MNRINLVLLDTNNMIFGPYLTTFDRILISLMPGGLPVACVA